MNRVGLIWNQNSHRNQGAGRGPVPDNVLEVVPEDPAQLFPALRRFAAEGVDLVVIDGGDGTVREVITRLPEAYGGPMPRLAVVPNGKTNALAIDIGTPLGTTLEQLLDYEALMQTHVRLSEDHKEGVAAFKEKRAPRFQGR